MKYALKPLAACMATLFGAASFNVWGAPPTTPPVQTQNQTPGGAQIGAPVATVPTILATRPMTSVFPTQPNKNPGRPGGAGRGGPGGARAAAGGGGGGAERPD